MNTVFTKCVFVLFVLLSVPSLFAQSRWSKLNSSTTKDLSFVAVLSRQIFAVGDSGIVLTAANSSSPWQSLPTPTKKKLTCITRSMGLIVAVGLNGTILTSSNDTSWQPQSSGTLQPLNSVLWSGKKFIAVGDSGTILTSSDGALWVKQLINKKYSLKSIAGDSSNLVAVGANKSANPVAAILTSNDGLTWTSQTSGSFPPLNCVIWVNKVAMFYAVGENGSIINSTDGSTWTLKNVDNLSLLSITTYYDDFLLTLGGSGTIFGKNRFSENWYKHNTSISGLSLKSLAWDGNYFYAVGQEGMVYRAPEDDTSVPMDIKDGTKNSDIMISISNRMLSTSLPQFMAGNGYSVQIFTLSGEKLFETSQFSKSINCFFSLGDFSSGVYQLIVSSGHKRLCKQFVYTR